ncbi:Antidote-toxin recognition MazE [Desulfitobacterium hafniense]|uniref:Antidote-toxin recognition MazE n=1 Tax=Desulfitobacterium hafniense TaxID=49338 RepID=A0A098B1E2_DESHA|nr:Antidote-toxin recognition MazE [Desulfitobacterium hafniense]
MKATGIVRRIDDLGRVVVPKNMRRILRVREGDPLEFYVTQEGEVVLRRYQASEELRDCLREEEHRA